MDRSWIQIKNRLDSSYQKGVEDFLQFAYSNRDPNSRIPCPCVRCNNYRDQPRDIVEDHLVINGIRRSYVRWTHHGEIFDDYPSDDDSAHSNDRYTCDYDDDSDDDVMIDMLHDIGNANWGDGWSRGDGQSSTYGDALCKFLKLLDDAKKELYPGHTHFSQLSFVVTLLHLKTTSGWTRKSFDLLLDVFRNALPSGASVPRSYEEAKKIVRDLGFCYEKIHACVNDCVLFRKENATLDRCPNLKCRESRYKSEGSKIPRKVLRYFPLKPRLQRLFANKEIAYDMRWHKDKRVQDASAMRHPADSEEWKHFDRVYASFAADPRNIRLGLASDGFNPYGNLSSVYSIWPVFLVPYNLPPWKCMKDPFFFMSMLIPGPKSPGNDIDVYLEPLIDELKELWDRGIETFDAFLGERFMLRAALLWTINDFPAYGILSGWSTKGYNACPICMTETSCVHLPNCHKLSYIGHRRFLPTNHRWRRDKKSFNGESDLRHPVAPSTGAEILEQLIEIGDIEFGKAFESLQQRKRQRRETQTNWTKKSIFFNLPYWKDLRVRHNVDIMHVVKNVFDAVFGTIMNIKEKTKDSWKCRKDLMEMGIRPELHLIPHGNTFVTPMACYNLSNDEKKKVCEFLKSVKYPDGFASNVSRCVRDGECRISALKSHDCYVFMQRILPLAIRGCLTKEVRQLLFELSDFFKKLCARTLHLNVLEEQEKSIAVILCKMERIFPPSFFDIMVHLLVHLPTEAKISGPAQYRWMFPFERKMGTLKGYVRNRSNPEGSIAERYIDNECLAWTSMYLEDVQSIFNRDERHYDRGECSGKLSVFSCTGRPFGGQSYHYLEDSELANIHSYVLKNCDEIEDYVNEHKHVLREENLHDVDKRHDLEFSKWFRYRVQSLEGIELIDELRSLAMGPDNRVRRFHGCNVNDYRFHTKDRELNRRTQNSGIVVRGEHGSNSVDFYGIIREILEIEYVIGRRKVIIFKCDWFNVGDNLGIQIDKEWKIISVNVARKWYIDQPYVLASQAEQVFYIQDMKLGQNWFVVESFKPRSSYDVLEHDDCNIDIEDEFQEDESNVVPSVVETDIMPTLAREILEPLECIVLDNLQMGSIEGHDNGDHDFINDNVLDEDIDSDASIEEEVWVDDDEED